MGVTINEPNEGEVGDLVGLSVRKFMGANVGFSGATEVGDCLGTSHISHVSRQSSRAGAPSLQYVLRSEIPRSASHSQLRLTPFL